MDPTKSSLLFLYDLPKSRVTSNLIAQVIKQYSGYILREPAQFIDRPLPNGLPSSFSTCICKIDPSQLSSVAEKMKYFQIEFSEGDSKTVWQCRGLPYDRDFKQRT